MDTLLADLQNGFDFNEVKIDLIRRGGDGNQTFLIETEGKKYIARIYGVEGQTHPDWVNFEGQLLNHVATKGISVSSPVTRRNGGFVGTVEGAPCVVFTFAEGSVEWPTRAENAHKLGSELARLHCAADSLVTDAHPRIFDADRLLWQPLERMLSFLPNGSETGDHLKRTAQRADELIKAIPQEGGAFGPIHGDIHQGNCHFQSDGHLTFFDFSNASLGWRAYDFCGFLWPLRDDTIENPDIRASCDGFLNGYRSVRPLLLEEEAAIPAFIKARDYWETGNWLLHDKGADPEVVCRGLNDFAALFTRYPLP